MKEFLQESSIIDYSTLSIQKLANELSHGLSTDKEIVKKCFEYVRDNIRHSGDYKDNIVTLKASEVLENKTGWCYAKSHLLAALLRVNNVPCALIYQRLNLNDDGRGEQYCLHGLNSVYLKDYGWYRLDPRGNKYGIDTQFNPPCEKLAFPIRFEGEYDLPKKYSEPIDKVIEVLSSSKSFEEVLRSLPDFKG